MKYLDFNLIYLNIYTINIRCNLMFCRYQIEIRKKQIYMKSEHRDPEYCPL